MVTWLIVVWMDVLRCWGVTELFNMSLCSLLTVQTTKTTSQHALITTREEDTRQQRVTWQSRDKEDSGVYFHLHTAASVQHVGMLWQSRPPHTECTKTKGEIETLRWNFKISAGHLEFQNSAIIANPVKQVLFNLILTCIMYLHHCIYQYITVHLLSWCNQRLSIFHMYFSLPLF